MPWLAERGVEIAPFKPANVGLRGGLVAPYGAAFRPAGQRRGADGRRTNASVANLLSLQGPRRRRNLRRIRALREGAALTLDSDARLSLAEVEARLAKMRSRRNRANRLRKLGLSPVAMALVMEFGRGTCHWRMRSSTCHVTHQGPRPMDEAISVAGGVHAIRRHGRRSNCARFEASLSAVKCWIGKPRQGAIC